MDAPFPLQYKIRVGKTEWGPTLAQRTPTPSPGIVAPIYTNMNYFLSSYLGMGLMFSRGGFMTPASQTEPSEKTLWAVPLYTYKGVMHEAGDSYDDILRKLAALPKWSPPGQQFRLRWGSTFTMTYDKRNLEAGDHNYTVYAEELVHVRANLHVAAGEDPEAPDSPPPFGQHGGDPVNFYGSSARLAAMSDMLAYSI